tara:strand:- start:1979 stop:2203 length:225 start_codon:yes stop_codon:yes gene_type:complete
VKLDVVMRVIGSGLVVLSYFILVHVSFGVGIVMQSFADAITVPYFIRTKSWDVVVMLAFLLIVSLSKIIPSYLS